MSSYQIDGVTLPEPVAGHPALDFCNTRAGWNSERRREYLVDAGVLAVWAGQAGLIGPAEVGGLRSAGPPEAAEVLRRTLAFREALYPVLLGRGSPAQWEVVSAEAAQARGRGRLQPAEPGSGPAPARWLQPFSGPDTALLTIAATAADFLTTARTGRVGACPGEGCGWLFLDPRGRRRWCSMAVCGNRAKARRHRQGGSAAPG